MMAKRIEPRVSLGTTMLAAMLPDLLWTVFLMAGIEHAELQAGKGAAHYFKLADIAISHSLLMDTVWAALLAAAYYWRRRYPRGAWVLFAAVLSHWLLDFVSNRGMPLAPGAHLYAGLGLWESIPATLILEGGFWLLAIILYTRATQPRSRSGLYGFWIVVALLTERWYANIAGPPPPNLRTAAIGGFIFFSLIVAWAYWMNRQRSKSTPTENHGHQSWK